MFEMENFEKELDEQNAALEAMLAELDESYSNSNNSLLDKVQATVDAKCTTVEACESMLAKLGNEISEFNNALSTMKSAVESYYTDGDKDALGDAIRPASDMIRSKYALIATEAVSSNGIVSDDEIKSVHDFLDGSKRIIRDKINYLRATANESFTEFDDYVDAAMEGVIRKLKDARATKSSVKRLANLNMLGISKDIDYDKINALMNDGKYDEAKNYATSFGKKIEAAKAKISDSDPDASKKRKIADNLIKTNSCLLVGIDTDAAKNKSANESFTEFDYLYDDNTTVAMEAVFDGLKRTIATLARNMVTFCKHRIDKATSKKNQKRYQFWVNMKEFFSGICEKMTGSMSEESLKKWHERVKAKQQKCNDVAKAEDAADNTERESAEESALFNVINMDYKVMEAAFEAYNNNDIATEGVLDTIGFGLIAASYGTLIGMAVKAGLSNENKYLRRLQKEFRPQEKELNKELKAAKRSRDYDKQIAIANKLIALNKSMIKDIEELGREVDKTYTKNSDGTTSEEFKMAFNGKQNNALEKAKSNIENLTGLIKMAEMDKKKASATESDVDAAFVAGYTRAIEAMSNTDSDIDDFLDNMMM